MDAVKKTTGAGQPADTESVRAVLARDCRMELDAAVFDDLNARLDVGESKYGHVLKVGWTEAEEQIYQELLDAYLYAISAGNDAMRVRVLACIYILRGQRGAACR